MLNLSPTAPVYIVHDAVDFRAGLDRLMGYCEGVLSLNPLSGAVFVFRNRQATAMKLVFFDGTGSWLCMKRLSKGRFQHWPCNGEKMSVVHARELLVLVWNGDPVRAAFQANWRPLRA